MPAVTGRVVDRDRYAGRAEPPAHLESATTPFEKVDGGVTREECLAGTLVELADTLADDFDVVELLVLLVDRSVELLDACAAGLVLVDARGELHLMASTTEAMTVMELFQVQNAEGPCLDCASSGQPVTVADLATAGERWPRFVPRAVEAGFRAVHAVPLRLRGQVLGALNLFRDVPGDLNPADLSAAKAMAAMAAIGILQARAAEEAHVVAEQLQRALHSRVAIEQAKGMLAQGHGTSLDQAFAHLRGYARRYRLPLTGVAEDLVAGTLDLDAVGGLAVVPQRA